MTAPSHDPHDRHPAPNMFVMDWRDVIYYWILLTLGIPIMLIKDCVTGTRFVGQVQRVWRDPSNGLGFLFWAWVVGSVGLLGLGVCSTIWRRMHPTHRRRSRRRHFWNRWFP